MAAIALQSKFVERKQFPKREKFKGSGRWPTTFTPFWLKDHANPPVFIMRIGGELERELFESEIAGRFNAPAGSDARRAVSPVLAFMKFCIGWKNVRDFETGQLIPFAQDRLGYVEQSAMARIDPLEMRAAGVRAYHLLTAN